MVEESFVGTVRRRCLRDPDRRALTFGDSTLTYAQMLMRFEALANALSGRGIRRGDRLLYAGLNHPSLLLTMLAAMDMGAVFVPVNPRLAASERAWVLDDLQPAAAVVAEEFEDDYAGSSPSLRVISADGQGDSSVERLVNQSQANPRVAADARDLATILYTSGTTGRPKGVMYTHETICANGANLARLLGARRDDVGIVMTPMFHTAGLFTSPVYLLTYGGEVVVLPRMDGGAALEAITRHRVTRIDTVTAALAVLCQTPGFTEADLSSVRSLLVGGTAIPAEHVAPFRRQGAEVFMAAGMTECTVACALAPEKLASKPEAVGAPLALVDSQLVDPASGFVLTEPGVTGEWCLRGPAVTTGYWNNSRASIEAFDPEGWFHTGDLARYDSDGDLLLVGRIKDVIKTGGESVAAAEVEAVVSRHPAVDTCAVVGLPDQRWGETVVAVVVTRPNQQLTLEVLRDFCEPHLARFKLPTRLIATTELPLTGSGKVAKHLLRRRLTVEPDGSDSWSRNR